MKMRFLPLMLSGSASLAFQAEAQTLNWGSLFASNLVDSKGQTLLESSYVFELGAFSDGFVPTSENVYDWVSHWVVYDRAQYSEANGYFTSTVSMNDDGTSSYHPAAGMSFEGLQGYVWVKNSSYPTKGTEWFLATADAWVFPGATPGCCDNQVPKEWSISDLDSSDVPLWGNQDGIIGDGTYSVIGNYDLQTFTFVPEPSSLLFGMLSATMLLRRRIQR